MRRTLPDDRDVTFDKILQSATASLWRFEQQRSYLVDDEAGLLGDFHRGVLTPPDRAPGLRAWFDQVRSWSGRGLYITRVRVVDEPPTEYQRWLQFVDRWNRDAGEEILYLPRGLYEANRVNRRAGLWPPFPGAANADWWLIDRKIALIMRRDAIGNRTGVELVDSGPEIVNAIQFAWRADRLALAVSRSARRPAA